MEIVKIKTNKGERKFIKIYKDEKCPLCGGKLGNFTWNTFHGEVSSNSCCRVPIQIKDYYIEENEPKEYHKLVDNIGSDYYLVNIGVKYLEPLKKAMKETGIYDCTSRELAKRVDEILEHEED